MAHRSMNSKISYKEVNEDVLSLITRSGPKYYILLVLVASLAIGLFFLPWVYQIYVGQGVSGLNVPNVWGIYLVNFVFWVGIAHAGTLISAMLYITKTPWRRSIARGAESMTLFALIIVTTFIFIHMGRPWNLYWPFPYPNQRGIWTSFQSPVMFDVIAISTYFTSSAVFLYFGMIPDFAALKHTATGWRKKLYTAMALGWRGTDKEWHFHAKASMFFAAFIMPLVVSVHTIVSWDFALSVVPGYSKTVFAPYFVTGALLSGFSGVILMVTLLRGAVPFVKKYITIDHFDKIGLFIIVLSLIWSYLTSMEIFTGIYADTPLEWASIKHKIFESPYFELFSLMIVCNTLVPLLMIIRKIRRTPAYMFIACIFIIIGMWLERYLIVPNALSRKFLPFMWHDYSPTWVEASITAGALFFFITMFLIYIKIAPVISIYEIKEDIGLPMKREHK